jgi:hypothetical protein
MAEAAETLYIPGLLELLASGMPIRMLCEKFGMPEEEVAELVRKFNKPAAGVEPDALDALRRSCWQAQFDCGIRLMQEKKTMPDARRVFDLLHSDMTAPFVTQWDRFNLRNMSLICSVSVNDAPAKHLQEATELLHEAKAALDPQDQLHQPLLIDIMNTYSVFLRQVGNWPQAVACLSEMLQWQRRLSGQQHSREAAWMLCMLLQILEQQAMRNEQQFGKLLQNVRLQIEEHYKARPADYADTHYAQLLQQLCTQCYKPCAARQCPGCQQLFCNRKCLRNHEQLKKCS